VWPTEEYELAKSLVDTSLPEDDLGGCAKPDGRRRRHAGRRACAGRRPADREHPEAAPAAL
ncbi:hypothetical protein ABZ070_28940, partial [Streptomyces sp. NPDC006283]